MQAEPITTPELEAALSILERLPAQARAAYDELRLSFQKEYQPQTPLEDRLLTIYTLALFQHERALIAETLFMERFLDDPENADLERRWTKFMRVATNKGRAAARAQKDLQTAMANRIIAHHITAENNQPIPVATPFVQLQPKAALAKFVTPRSIANSAIIPVSATLTARE